MVNLQKNDSLASSGGYSVNRYNASYEVAFLRPDYHLNN